MPLRRVGCCVDLVELEELAFREPQGGLAEVPAQARALLVRSSALVWLNGPTELESIMAETDHGNSLARRNGMPSRSHVSVRKSFDLVGLAEGALTCLTDPKELELERIIAETDHGHSLARGIGMSSRSHASFRKSFDLVGLADGAPACLNDPTELQLERSPAETEQGNSLARGIGMPSRNHVSVRRSFDLVGLVEGALPDDDNHSLFARVVALTGSEVLPICRSELSKPKRIIVASTAAADDSDAETQCSSDDDCSISSVENGLSSPMHISDFDSVWCHSDQKRAFAEAPLTDRFAEAWPTSDAELRLI